MRAVNERCALPEMPLSLKLTLLIAAHAALGTCGLAVRCTSGGLWPVVSRPLAGHRRGTSRVPGGATRGQ